MAELWIIHRDERVRASLARVVGVGEAMLASPGEARLEAAGAPLAVLLGVSGDFEAELEFAHRARARMPSTHWLVVAEARDLADAERLFQGLGEAFLPWPAAAHELRERVRTSLARRDVATLATRRMRDAVAGRFARWFRDLTLPEILLALDPRLVDVPVLIGGEPGTGRGILARYLHHFGHPGAGRFATLPCAGAESGDSLRRRLPGLGPGRVTVCLEDVDVLPAALQRELRDWVELGPPEPLASAGPVRWVATHGDPLAPLPGRTLDPELAQVLSGIVIRVPPLRERPNAIGAFAEETTAEWCRMRGERPRALAPDAVEALQGHLWPGNLRELESLLVRTLAAESAETLHAGHLRFGTEATPAGAEAPVETLPEAESLLEALKPEPTPEAPLEPEPSLPSELEVEVEAEPEPAAPPPAGFPRAAPLTFSDPTLRRLAGAVAHEVGNPLVAIRTLADLLPERHDDPDFRERFVAQVSSDTGRIERVVERLARFAEMPAPSPARVDVAELLERLLEARRRRVAERRLLVLQELDRDEPVAWADPEQLAFAFEAILDRAIELVPERGDLYLASKHHPGEAGGEGSVRVLLRFQRAPGAPGVGMPAGLGIEETALELPVAEAVLRAQGGQVTVDASRADETLVLLDLPAPAAAR